MSILHQCRQLPIRELETVLIIRVRDDLLPDSRILDGKSRKLTKKSIEVKTLVDGPKVDKSYDSE